jgi:hypothetical protein
LLPLKRKASLRESFRGMFSKKRLS